MNTIDSDKRYGCFNGNQLKESLVVKSSHVCENKNYDKNNFMNLWLRASMVLLRLRLSTI